MSMPKLRARITPDGFDWLKRGSHKPNIELLESAVDRLCLALSQGSSGQRKEDNPGNSVNWQSPELDMIHWIILTEAVALVLSGKLDALKEAA